MIIFLVIYFFGRYVLIVCEHFLKQYHCSELANSNNIIFRIQRIFVLAPIHKYHWRTLSWALSSWLTACNDSDMHQIIILPRSSFIFIGNQPRYRPGISLPDLDIMYIVVVAVAVGLAVLCKKWQQRKQKLYYL